ncbi:MAG: glucuronate isomerase [Desulfobacteraceae bacterium]|nr:MAG: glucuronate isomerase [Desulfobacteraceae bacterium]
MTPFLSDVFLLQTESAKKLYHEYAEDMPIYDYHCHLPVREIAENKIFENLTQVWLYGDHYKWRAMRTNGVHEKYITGDATDFEKFEAWAATVPKTLCNPLYHWTHLELKRYFGIEGKLLNADTAKEIYNTCNAMLQTDAFSTQRLLQQMNVRVVCTTDDPTDSLEYHLQLKENKTYPILVFPAFRPDKAMTVESPERFNAWVNQLEVAADTEIRDYKSYMDTLHKRHDFFHKVGCRLSDHGIDQPYAYSYTEAQIRRIFTKVRSGETLLESEILQFKSAMLMELALMDAEKGWTQQFHMGALRNTNARAMQQLGPDTGYDAIGDFEIARPLALFMDQLEHQGKLTKTILYVINPRDNELVAAMIGNFQDGIIPGKIQFGAAWWFNDQKDGIIQQINALSNMGLLSRFVGMLTDSRSFLSYPRHEYFRRVLCNLLGNDMENGELPNDLELIGNMVKDICYNNAANYFGIDVP